MAKVVLMALYAVGVQYVMDEYVPLGFYGELIGSFYRGVDPIKTVLHVYFYQAVTWFADGAVAQMTAARLETLLAALVGLAVVCTTARNLGRNRLEALFGVFVLLSFTTYLERAFRVRSDSFAAMFGGLALWAVARRGVDRGWALGAGVFAGLAFACTQKSLYLFLALLAGCVFDWWFTRRRRSLVTAGWIAVGWGLVLLAYGLVIGGVAFPQVIRAVFTSPFEVAFEAHELYPAVGRYVIQTLERNPFPYFLCFAGLALALLRARDAGGEGRRAAGFSLVVALLVFSHNQPWPYVFVFTLPSLSLWGVELLRRFPSERSAHLAMLATVLLLGLSLPRNVSYLENDNRLQNRVVSQAESLLAPNETYCDGIRMVVTRSSACRRWWDAMTIHQIVAEHRRGDFSEIEDIFERQPKLWIFTYRLQNLWAIFGPHIVPSYARVTPNILLSGARLAPSAATNFLNRWRGSYELYGPEGRPLDQPYEVDGRVVEGVVELEAGRRYGVRSLGPTEAYLLPVGTRLVDPIPRDGAVPRLFARAYER